MFEGGGMIDIGKDLQDAFDDGYRQAMQDRWIPVSEKLPEEDENYLVTMKHKEFNQTKVTSMDFNGEFLFSDCFEKAWWEVTAWRPLPEPYKELAADNNVVTKSSKDNNALTIGDKIRECGEKLSKFIEAVTNIKDTALSPEEVQELKAERDYWEREAKKWCAKLGEIRLWIGAQN